MRVLSQLLEETSAAGRRSVDAALRAFDLMVARLSEVESPAGLRSFRRELYRTWAAVLDARDAVVDVAHVRVFDEVEESLEATHALVLAFERRAAEPARR